MSANQLTTFVLSPKKLRNFWARVNKDGPVPAHCPELGPCWIWTGALGPRSGEGRYGLMMIRRRYMRAHRAAWVIEHGSIPVDQCVLHRCDNPPCVNPGHLFLGTLWDNMADMKAKGRHARGDACAPKQPSCGERNGSSRLTANNVRAIREWRARGKSLKRIAAKFGVTVTQVSRICRGLAWPHLLDDNSPHLERRENLKGVNNPASKLSADDVRAIRREYAAGGVTLAALGERFGVSKPVVHKIVTGAAWKHVV